MALPLGPRLTPQCTTCLRNYAFGATTGLNVLSGKQQVRGKKKMPNNSGTMTVRLLKNVKGYGRKGALVPISPGAMRNMWFPAGTAEYVTMPELKRLRLNNVAMERDFGYGLTELVQGKEGGLDANGEWQKDIPSDIKGMTNAQLRAASAAERAKMLPSTINEQGNAGPPMSKRAVDVDRLTPDRSLELVENFVPRRLDFYRSPIAEEKVPEPEEPAPETPQFGGAAGDLLAARTRRPKKIEDKPQAIYGSVSSHDILMAVRAVMSENEEAARVVLQDSDISIVDLANEEGAEAGRAKHIGDFIVEFKLKGSELVVQRTVRILPQER